ncbi:MAG: M23 family metallopeptidase [Bacteroidota bacterium]
MKIVLKYILSLFLICTFLSSVNAGEIKNPTENGKDTTKAKINLKSVVVSEELESIEDEEILASEEQHEEHELSEDEDNIFLKDPSFDAYGIWDTVSVNPYKMDLSKKTDTTIIKLQDHYQCDYFHPYKGRVTSNFGPRSRVRYHYGTDIDLETGDSVYCAFEGTVRVSRKSSSYGNVVVVRHKNGLETVYAHLSRLDVKIGEHVEAGDLLGLGGNTGRSRGSHLHFEVRFKGQPINPNTVINFESGCLATNEIAIDKNSFKYIADFKAEASKIRYYKVKRGDTLSKIARNNRTTVAKLRKLNKMSSKAVLKAGKRIRVA